MIILAEHETLLQAQSRQQTLLQHAALPLILQHPSVTGQLQTVCRLLCTSKGMRAAVAQCSVGLVPLSFRAGTLQKAEQFAEWLAGHAALLKHLGIALPLGARSEAEAVIAAALQHARTATRQQQRSDSSPPPAQALQLHTYTCETASSAAGRTLQQLPCSHLTRLELVLAEPLQHPIQTAVALAGLTGLHSLKLHYSNSSPIVDALLPALSPLRQLTFLDLSRVQNVAELQQLPPQLRHATIRVAAAPAAGAGGQRGPLQLQHLTALTDLQFVGARGLTLLASDVLPPDLHTLMLDDCVSSQPLLPLTKLQHVLIRRSTTPADELLQLRQLSGLTKLKLVYEDAQDAVADAAAAWGRLPVDTLILNFSNAAHQRQEGSLSGATVEQLRQLQGMKLVSIAGARIAATPSQLAGVLGQLTGLTRLVLISNRMLPEPGDAAEGAGHEAAAQAAASAEAAGMKALVRAIAGLPQLGHLHLGSIALGPAAAQLTAATLLTQLHLQATGPIEFALNSMALSLTNLKRLEVIHNPQLTDVPMPVIAGLLPQLTALSFAHTAVTDVGVECLSRLQQLRLLEVSGTAVSAAAKRRALRQPEVAAAGAAAVGAAAPAVVAVAVAPSAVAAGGVVP